MLKYFGAIWWGRNPSCMLGIIAWTDLPVQEPSPPPGVVVAPEDGEYFSHILPCAGSCEERLSSYFLLKSCRPVLLPEVNIGISISSFVLSLYALYGITTSPPPPPPTCPQNAPAPVAESAGTTTTLGGGTSTTGPRDKDHENLLTPNGGPPPPPAYHGSSSSQHQQHPPQHYTAYDSRPAGGHLYHHGGFYNSAASYE